MHHNLLKQANEEQLREFVTDSLDMIKETNISLYNELELHLYKHLYGCHFNDILLSHALKGMINEDGTTGKHWTVEQTNSLAKQHGIVFDNYNEYDWNYVMNMIYSDYYGSVINDTSTYVKLSRKFIEDKDAPIGKAFIYYMAMKK